MAVILASQPDDTTTIDKGLCFGLIMTDIGDDTITKELAWQLECEGVPLTDIIVEKPKAANTPIFINPIDLIEWRLKTTIPKITSDIVQDDDKFKKEVVLKYGEAIFDSEDCENNSVDVSGSSNTITVINSICQLWEQGSFLPEVFPLAHLGGNTTQCKGTYDWIWLCNSSISVEVVFDGGGSVLNNYTATGAQYIAIGSANVDISGGVIGVTRDNISCIRIYGANPSGVGQLLSTVNIVPCCCDEECRVDLYFLDPKGSWRAVGGFKCLDSRSTEFDGTVICKEMPCNVSYDTALREYGNTFLRKKGFTNITFKEKFRITCENREFYEAMGGSGHYLIRIGNLITRFIATTKSVPNFSDNDLTEITFSGYYNHEYRGHLLS